MFTEKQEYLSLKNKFSAKWTPVHRTLLLLLYKSSATSTNCVRNKRFWEGRKVDYTQLGIWEKFKILMGNDLVSRDKQGAARSIHWSSPDLKQE